MTASASESTEDVDWLDQITDVRDVRITLGALSSEGISELRWRLHEWCTNGAPPAVVDLTDLDETDHLLVFAVLVHAAQEFRAAGSELQVTGVPAAMQPGLGVSGIRQVDSNRFDLDTDLLGEAEAS